MKPRADTATAIGDDYMIEGTRTDYSCGRAYIYRTGTTVVTSNVKLNMSICVGDTGVSIEGRTRFEVSYGGAVIYECGLLCPKREREWVSLGIEVEICNSRCDEWVCSRIKYCSVVYNPCSVRDVIVRQRMGRYRISSISWCFVCFPICNYICK